MGYSCFLRCACVKTFHAHVLPQVSISSTWGGELIHHYSYLVLLRVYDAVLPNPGDEDRTAPSLRWLFIITGGPWQFMVVNYYSLSALTKELYVCTRRASRPVRLL